MLPDKLHSPRDCKHCGSDQVVRITSSIKPPLFLMQPDGDVIHHNSVPKEFGADNMIDFSYCKSCNKIIQTR